MSNTSRTTVVLFGDKRWTHLQTLVTELSSVPEGSLLVLELSDEASNLNVLIELVAEEAQRGFIVQYSPPEFFASLSPKYALCFHNFLSNSRHSAPIFAELRAAGVDVRICNKSDYPVKSGAQNAR